MGRPKQSQPIERDAVRKQLRALIPASVQTETYLQDFEPEIRDRLEAGVSYRLVLKLLRAGCPALTESRFLTFILTLNPQLQVPRLVELAQRKRALNQAPNPRIQDGARKGASGKSPS